SFVQMTVIVFTCHFRACKYAGDRFYRRCDCKKWLEYFHNHRQIRRSAKTRSFERASQDARQLEQELEAAVRGEVVYKKTAHITVKDAIDRHIAERETTGKAKEASGIRKVKRMLGRLKDYCDSKGVLFLKDCTADHLSAFRQT